jgi:hypothetical protein
MARDPSPLTRVHTLLDQLMVEQAPAPTRQTPGQPAEEESLPAIDPHHPSQPGFTGL